ncbi:MAG: hypothetical protein IJ570_06885 [Prevotella sp.]|nr:hypothetical protein [Prevotella sp.]
MKKLFLSFFMAVLAVSGTAQVTDLASPVELNARHSKQAKALNSSVANRQVGAGYKLVKRGQQHRIESTLDALLGEYVQVYYDYYDNNRETSTVLNIVKDPDVENGVIINGWWDAYAQPLKATVDLEAETITIPRQLIWVYDDGEESDTPAYFVNFDDPDSDYVGEVYDDGFVFTGSWGAQLENQDLYYAVGNGAYLLRPNATFSYTYGEQTVAESIRVVQNEETKMVSILNFAGLGATVGAQLTTAGSFYIDEQFVIYFSDNGSFYTYALADGDLTNPITGQVDGATLTFDTHWTVYAPETDSWYGDRGPATITRTDGVEFQLPDTDADRLVVVPATAERKDFVLQGSYREDGNTYQLNEQVQVAFNGSDVYLQGIPRYFPESWIKGTISGSQAVFPFGQFVGADEYGSEYMIGFNSVEDEVTDIVFDYDADSQTFTQADGILIMENGAADEYDPWVVFTGLTIGAGQKEELHLVEVPEDLQTEAYLLSATDTYYERSVSYAVEVGFDGADVYFHGLSSFLPAAWVKGSLEDGVVTVPEGQFLGQVDTWNGALDLLFDGAVFSYDAQTGTFYAADGFTTTYSNGYKADELEDLTLARVIEKAGTPATPEITYFDAEWGELNMNVPLLDTEGNPMVSAKLGYQLLYDIEGEQSVYVFNASAYKCLDEDLTVIPYDFNDAENYDIERGGRIVYVYGNNFSQWTLVGVKSIYTGGGETHESEVCWYDIETGTVVTGIKNVGQTTPVAVSYFDLQGRRVASGAQPTKGLLLRQQSRADGRVQTVKVVRR